MNDTNIYRKMLDDDSNNNTSLHEQCSWQWKWSIDAVRLDVDSMSIIIIIHQWYQDLKVLLNSVQVLLVMMEIIYTGRYTMDAKQAINIL